MAAAVRHEPAASSPGAGRAPRPTGLSARCRRGCFAMKSCGGRAKGLRPPPAGVRRKGRGSLPPPIARSQTRRCSATGRATARAAGSTAGAGRARGVPGDEVSQLVGELARQRFAAVARQMEHSGQQLVHNWLYQFVKTGSFIRASWKARQCRSAHDGTRSRWPVHFQPAARRCCSPASCWRGEPTGR